MSSSGPSNGQAKRPHDGTEDGQPAPKSSRTNEAPPEQQEETPHLHKGSRKRRILRGPNGEAMIPDSFPVEWADSGVIDVLNIPTGGDFTFDEDHGMTLKSRAWWEDYGPWIDARKEGLKLSAEIWKMRDEAMQQDATAPEDEGADDWDFICVPSHDDEERGFGGKFEGFEDKEEDEDDEEGQQKTLQTTMPRRMMIRGLTTSSHHSTQSGLGTSPCVVLIATGGGRKNVSSEIQTTSTTCASATNSLLMVHLSIQIAKFDSAFQPKSTYRDFWPEVEGLALVLQNGMLNYDRIGDDKRREMANEIVGYLILATIDALKKQNVFKPDSGIRNLGLVLFMFVQWKLDHCYHIPTESLFWMCKIVELAEEANVNLTSPYDFEKDFKRVKYIHDRWAKRMDKWENLDWQSRLREYKDNTGSTKFGGDYFDITIMSRDDRYQREREWRPKVQIR
ncbi:amine oxidase flavin-containing protein [Fusarium mundagurra]|uniref:Amine oxidase flavin-containing protein n=1 Tax=Fusarium mundagurra TaxID=1567541 RepID=A0A8H6DGQ4_9HYPO|nr:amine oxidase flavin-containing protein [Fusarium mundagurra]